MADLGTRTLTISIGGVDYTTQVSKAEFHSAESDSDFTSFFDAANGGARDYTLEITAKQDLAAGTFWRRVFDNPGTTVAVLVKPYGNATASATQPHYTSSATIIEPEGRFLGMEADKSTTAKATIEVSFPCTRPVAVTA